MADHTPLIPELLVQIQPAEHPLFQEWKHLIPSAPALIIWFAQRMNETVEHKINPFDTQNMPDKD